MTESKQAGAAQRLTFGQIIGAALIVGLTSGALFTIRETARACELFHESFRAELGNVVSLALGAAAWYCGAGCILTLLAGLGVWAVVRVHGYRLDGARAAALCAGMLLCVALPSALWVARPYGSVAREYVKGSLLPEMAFLTAFSAVGFGTVVYVIGRRAGTLARLAALAAGLVAALSVFVCWNHWLSQMKLIKRFGHVGRLHYVLLFVLVLALAAGLYRLVLAALARREPRARRRAVQGAVLFGAAVALLAAGSWAAALPAPRWKPPAQPDDRPNIVWLIMDTARADAYSCYGNPRKTSPCLDRMAAEGVVFERAYVNSSWTLPSHASMFTGQLPSKCGTTAEQGLLWDYRTTIAELLAQGGYATFGCSSNLNVCGLRNTDQGFERFLVYPWGRGPENPLLLTHARKGLHLTDDGAAAFNRTAARWIEEAHEARRPFFLFINYFEVHGQYGTTPYLGRWLPPGMSVEHALNVPQVPEKYFGGVVPPQRRDFEALRALYEGDVTYLDERIGELLDRLRALGILDNTLFIITSDHGDELGERQVIGHRFGLRNTLLHVPLVVRYPKRFQPGTRRGDIVELTAIFPTLLDAAGLAWDGRATLDGRSLFEPPLPDAEQFAIAQRDVSIGWIAKMLRDYAWWNGVPFMRRQMCIQDRRYKYVWSSDDTAELFDLTQDPLEEQNVLDRFPQEAARLRGALEARIGVKLKAGMSAAGIAAAAGEAAKAARSSP